MEMKNKIREICYMQYKSDWKHKHGIGIKEKINSIRDYRKFLEENGLDKDSYKYSKYLQTFGYNGELYACYEEFLKTEYLDCDYICGLLKSEKLIAIYREDIKM